MSKKEKLGKLFNSLSKIEKQLQYVNGKANVLQYRLSYRNDNKIKKIKMDDLIYCGEDASVWVNDRESKDEKEVCFEYRFKVSPRLQEELISLFEIPVIDKYDHGNYEGRDILLHSIEYSYHIVAVAFNNEYSKYMNKYDAIDYRSTSGDGEITDEYILLNVRYLFANGVDTYIRYKISRDDYCADGRTGYHTTDNGIRELFFDEEDYDLYHEFVDDLFDKFDLFIEPVLNHTRGFVGYDKKMGKPDPSGDDKWWVKPGKLRLLFSEDESEDESEDDEEDDEDGDEESLFESEDVTDDDEIPF